MSHCKRYVKHSRYNEAIDIYAYGILVRFSAGRSEKNTWLDSRVATRSGKFCRNGPVVASVNAVKCSTYFLQTCYRAKAGDIPTRCCRVQRIAED